MKLKNLNKMVFKYILSDERTLTEMAAKLKMPLNTFKYKTMQGTLEWEEIKSLKLPFTRAEFTKAIERDFK